MELHKVCKDRGLSLCWSDSLLEADAFKGKTDRSVVVVAAMPGANGQVARVFVSSITEDGFAPDLLT